MKIHKSTFILIGICLNTLLFSCKDEALDIRGDFPYTVTVDSLPRQILVDNQLPLRLTINVGGNYTDAKFTLDYVLREGKGELKTDQGVVFASGKSISVKPGAVNLIYTPTSIGKTDMFFTVRDNFGQEQKQEVTFEPVANAPAFNFVVQTVSGVETISRLQIQEYTFYLRQQEFYLKDQIYKLTFSCSNNFDGTLTVNGQTWRQGDLIPITYDQVKDTNFTFRGTYKPIEPAVGNYTITFTCTDKFGVSKSQAKPITVN